jgi:hypothetical protein
MEPDHSASIQAFVEKFPNATVVGNKKTFKMIGQFFPELEMKNTLEVENGDKLDLGGHELNFVFAPMVHWPEVMMTYDPAEKKARTVYLCEEHQEKLYKRIVDCMLDMGTSHIRESEESSVMQRRMRYNYRPQWSGYDCCMNCMHLFFVGPHGLTCNVIGGRIYKGDTCSAFKRRAYVINEGTPDERIIERIKETMDNSKPMPIMTPPELHWDIAHMKDIAKVLSWMYARGIHMCGTDEEIEAAIRRIGGEEE